jgi:TolA-binding protein
MLKWLGCLLLMTLVLSVRGVSQSAPAPTTPTAPAPAAQAAPPQPVDELAQMRDDLNKLDSLNLNMSSEIEFLRDQNLQILLRTNSQMWTVLIRDLRRQIDREEQRRAAPVRPSGQSSSAKPDR